uniref:Outer membrane lipoprotein carrier protein LolA n=1 Tax=candidate division WOR-3 bacterium TaxID=2052148 RepID=A0A7C2P2R5_UNCW3
MFLIILLLTQVDSTFFSNLKEKPFKTSFVEIVKYKEFETQDTFKGTILRRGSNITMALTYPSKETYIIKNDTLFIESQGKETAFPLEEDALKLLNFHFLNDSLNFHLEVYSDTLILKSKNESLFLVAKLVIQNGIPEEFFIEDREKILRFFFKNWKFYE